MSNPIRFRLAVLAAAAVSLAAAPNVRADAKGDLRAAVQKLSQAKTYAFTTSHGGEPGPSGEVEKDGYALLTVPVPGQDATKTMAKKGDRVVIETDDGWKTAEDLKAAKGPDRYLAMAGQAFVPPAAEAQQRLDDASAVTRADDGTYTLDLPEDAAKKMLAPGRTSARAGHVQVLHAQATVRFTLADGSLTKMDVKVTGTIAMDGTNHDVHTQSTTEIKDVGTATVDVPDAAKAKLTPA